MYNLTHHIRIRRGWDIPVAGAAERTTTLKVVPRGVYCYRTDEFRNISPRPLVPKDFEVQAGTPLWCDAARPDVQFCSPLAGTVEAVVRDDDGFLQEIRIRAAQEQGHIQFPVAKLASMNRNTILHLMLQGGLWSMIVQRPFGVIPDPDTLPDTVFISAFSTAPLAPDYDYSLAEDFEAAQMGVDVLLRLSRGGVHVSLQSDNYAGTPFHKLSGVQLHSFSGPHPTGNVGVQIAAVAPVRPGERIWTVSMDSLVAIGRFFISGVLDLTRKVAVTGPAAIRPSYVECLPGCPLSEFSHYIDHLGKVRIISGDMLCGHKVEEDGHLRFFDSQLTLLPESEEREFLGWMKFKRRDKPSFSLSYLSRLQLRPSRIATGLNGAPHRYMAEGLYEQVLPMDIFPSFLFKAILEGDVEQMKDLGIYEVLEEDVALCEYVCPSKLNLQNIITEGIRMMLQKDRV